MHGLISLGQTGLIGHCFRIDLEGPCQDKKVIATWEKIPPLSQDFYPSDLLFLESRVRAEENGSEQRRQMQSGGRDAKHLS
jgi:hypothetical protein